MPRTIAALVRPLSSIGSWAILVFELAFPLAFASPIACTVLLCMGAAFHVANAITFGLNRFLWAWIAAYPALLYWVQR